MNKKKKDLGSKVNSPVDKQKQKTLTLPQLLNLGYSLGEKCEVKRQDQIVQVAEVLDEDNKAAGFSVGKTHAQHDWHVLPYPYSEYRPKKKHANSK